VELRKEKNSLLVPTPSTTDPEGNNWFHSLISSYERSS
jgi:hypothetical protein